MITQAVIGRALEVINEPSAGLTLQVNAFCQRNSGQGLQDFLWCLSILSILSINVEPS
jgi:hypothetical protein